MVACPLPIALGFVEISGSVDLVIVGGAMVDGEFEFALTLPTALLLLTLKMIVVRNAADVFFFEVVF